MGKEISKAIKQSMQLLDLPDQKENEWYRQENINKLIIKLDGMRMNLHQYQHHITIAFALFERPELPKRRFHLYIMDLLVFYPVLAFSVISGSTHTGNQVAEDYELLHQSYELKPCILEGMSDITENCHQGQGEDAGWGIFNSNIVKKQKALVV